MFRYKKENNKLFVIGSWTWKRSIPCRTNVCLSEENSSSGTPPPLPPKRRTRTQQLLDESEGLLASSLDRVSLRSRSPEDSSSLLSASAGSLDSALNHSRDEDEIRAIMGPNDESLNDSMDLSLMATIQGNVRTIYTKMFICNVIIRVFYIEILFLIIVLKYNC